MADYFIKKNSVYYINQDIYDNNGVLLLRKGQRITDEIKNKLERLGKYDSNKIDHASDKQSDILAPVTKELSERINLRNNRIIEKPNEVLSTIIFESRKKPWWIC